MTPRALGPSLPTGAPQDLEKRAVILACLARSNIPGGAKEYRPSVSNGGASCSSRPIFRPLILKDIMARTFISRRYDLPRSALDPKNMENGKWKMVNGKSKIENGNSKMVAAAFCPLPFDLFLAKALSSTVTFSLSPTTCPLVLARHCSSPTVAFAFDMTRPI
jgi:hypothetical protein